MGYLHEKAGIVLRMGVLAMLLAVQSLSITHEMDHVSADEASLCAVCSVFSGNDMAVHVEHCPPPATPRSSVDSSDHGSSCDEVAHDLYLSRAPPTLS